MLNVKRLRSEPFVWIHLSGIVLFPILLEVAWIGLSLGNRFTYILELALLIGIGVFPVLLMQLTRPFNIFSILLVSLKAECLSEEQRQILALFRTVKQKFFSIVTAGIMILVLLLLYRLSPLAVGIANFLPQWHILGLAIATVAFLGGNLFLQVPLSVLLVLLTKESKLAEIEPYPIEKMNQSFTTPGIKVSKILWFLEPTLETTDNA